MTTNIVPTPRVPQPDTHHRRDPTPRPAAANLEPSYQSTGIEEEYRPAVGIEPARYDLALERSRQWRNRFYQAGAFCTVATWWVALIGIVQGIFTIPLGAAFVAGNAALWVLYHFLVLVSRPTPEPRPETPPSSTDAIDSAAGDVPVAPTPRLHRYWVDEVEWDPYGRPRSSELAPRPSVQHLHRSAIRPAAPPPAIPAPARPALSPGRTRLARPERPALPPASRDRDRSDR